ncbi:hypothetical protein I8748_21505 [Nostoc sp. CENA67]|uniref:Uncharacterized protein n=1 Tax=Amazonocrinis nigriterrae CENA67 TaxID=2794033 RepID=A0A8J7HSK1_9NOST|nr:hypothetical protein [Amazonocrinis nigriterrae]MBH8564727.1 hypothetical protein [Amazonocrinis nigriterrae CENA67]
MKNFTLGIGHGIVTGAKPQPEAKPEQTLQQLLNYAGAISLGYPTGIDNESIDADLAKAYANDF